MSALEVNPVTMEECLAMLKTQAEEIERLESMHVLKNQIITEFGEMVEQLTAKHDALTKRLRDTQNIPMSLNSGYVRWDVINAIITESGDTK